LTFITKRKIYRIYYCFDEIIKLVDPEAHYNKEPSLEKVGRYSDPLISYNQSIRSTNL
jgi:hypothetical protein